MICSQNSKPKGEVPNGDSALTAEELETLYRSNHLSHSYPATFQCRLIGNIELITAMRPTELHWVSLKTARAGRTLLN